MDAVRTVARQLVAQVKWWLGDVPASYSFRRRLAYMLNAAPIGNAWDILQTMLSVVGCVSYVCSTYDIDTSDTLEYLLTLLFTVDLLMRWYVYHHPATFFFSGLNPWVDLACVVPTYVTWLGGSNSPTLNFVRFLRILRVLRILRTFRILRRAMTPLTRQVIHFVLVLLSLLFINAALINLAEVLLWTDLMGLPQSDAPNLSFANALWLSLVTMATVGYGDYYPVTPLGKAIMSGFIVTVIVLVPLQVNALADVLALQSRYRTVFHPDPTAPPHLIVTGHVADVRVVGELLKELYHPERISALPQAEADAAESRVTVILGPEEPSDGVKAMLAHPLFEQRLRYVRGSVMVPDDLARVALGHAAACFILGNTATADPEAEDRKTALQTLTLRNAAPEGVRVFVQLSKSRSLANIDSSDEIAATLVVDEWTNHLLAQSALLPGFSTLLYNLLRSVTAEPSPAVAERSRL
jgi:voltage-gated potassium channel Kch